MKMRVTIGGFVKYGKGFRLWPRNKFFNAVFHKFFDSDVPGVLHNHQYDTISILLWGKLLEETCDGYDLSKLQRTVYKAPAIIFRPHSRFHRIELVDNKPFYTLFLTGLDRHEWGFLTAEGYKPNVIQ